MDIWSAANWSAVGTVVTALVALLALLRPELTTAVRRRRGQLEIYEIGEAIEIGFGGAGPTVGIDLNLRALHRAFFVLSAQLEVTRLADGARHLLSWGALRHPGPFFPGTVGAPILEVPAGFQLRLGEVRRLNVAFNDRHTRDQILQTLQPLRTAFFEALNAMGIGSSRETMEELRLKMDGIISAAENTESWAQAWTRLQKLCYWDEGSYEAKLTVRCADPETEWIRHYRFELSEAESQALHGNAVVLQRQNVGPTDWQLNFVYPKLHVITA